MPDSYPFPTYSGLLEPKHYKQIGSALWLFLWCVSSTTREREEDGVIWGLVLGGKPNKLPELAAKFGVNDKTVSRWLEALEQHSYVRLKRAPHGLIIEVKNSKRQKGRTDRNVRSDANEPTDMSDLPPGEQTKMSDHSHSEQTIMSDHPDKNVRSNKDIIKILIDRLIADLPDSKLKESLIERCGALSTAVGSFSKGQIHLDEQTLESRISEIVHYYNARKGRHSYSNADWPSMQEVAKEQIPLDFILWGIDLAFARHERSKKWARDTITHFAYCSKVVLGTWYQLQSDIAAAQAAPVSEGTVIPFGKQTKRSRQQEEIDELQRFIREERERERR
jgi:hypothetical protein